MPRAGVFHFGASASRDGAAAPASVPAVALHDVSVAYGSHQALSHVTATFPRGATGLLGPNGAGKSSLVLAVLGLVEPVGGRVEVLGTDVTRSPARTRARIGYMPERDAYIPDMSAVSAVAYCGALAGLSPADAFSRAHDVLTWAGLGESRYRDAETFSAGMRQRLKLAQAIVHDPDLLLLDEPTNGLDPRGRDHMLALVGELTHRWHVDLIFSSHVLADVERVCETVVVLNHGVVAGSGRIGARPDAGERTYEVRVKGDVAAFTGALEADGFGCEAAMDGLLRVVVPDGTPRCLFAAAARLGVQVRHLRPLVETLDEYFERVTRVTDHES
jgi:ABC-2 type transport system ATP-binding protein